LRRIFHLASAVMALMGCAASTDMSATLPPHHGQAEETRVVFSALGCAFEQARAHADGAEAKELDQELAQIEAALRRMNDSRRPCSDLLVERLTRCIRVSFDGDRVLTEWRADGACSAPDLARYVN
jgi:hypothetical protein